MRFRSLLASGVVGLLLLGTASPALAELSKEEQDCVLEQAEAIRSGKEAETCEEAPNPILPATNEIIWGAISFLVVFGALTKLALPAIRKGLKAREDRIRGDLEQAEFSKQEADQVLEEYRHKLADARNEAGRIIEEARQAADGMRREIQERAEQDAVEIRARAQAEIDATVARARADLQREVANFAVSLAERVVERNLDREAQTALVERYIQEVGGMRPNGNG